MKKEYIPLRLPKEDAEFLEEEARKEGIGKSVLARKLLIEAIAECRIKRAIEEYLDEKCSLGYAASIAKLSIRDFLAELIRRGYVLRYTKENLEKNSGSFRS